MAEERKMSLEEIEANERRVIQEALKELPTKSIFSRIFVNRPRFAFVIAISESITVAVGGTTAQRSPVRMMSVTFSTSARPIAPAGWFIA